MDDTPEYFYKYRSVNHNDLDKDMTLNALFNSYSIFSSRRSFNDPFDSKIILLEPSVKELKNIVNYLNYKHPLTKNMPILPLKNFVDKNQKITQEGNRFISNWIDGINKKIDLFTCYCLSSDIDNILLWSHYAGSHTGFCIEFRSRFIEAKKVNYDIAVPSFKFSDLLTKGEEDEDRQIGEKIQKALLVKLDWWKYENEYRVLHTDKAITVKVSSLNRKAVYTQDFVESIIFGSRMPQKTKDYIIRICLIKSLISKRLSLIVLLKLDRICHNLCLMI